MNESHEDRAVDLLNRTLELISAYPEVDGGFMVDKFRKLAEEAQASMSFRAVGTEIAPEIKEEPKPRPLFSILILSIPSRLGKLIHLMAELQRQIGSLPVEVLVITDNKKRTIGEKRDALVQMANGEYMAFFDDDDWPLPGYVEEIISAIKERRCPGCHGLSVGCGMIRPQECGVCCSTGRIDVDIIVFNQQASLNGKEFTVRFGLEYENEQANLDENGNYPPIIYRKPFHICVWRSDLAKKYRVPFQQYAEDWAWTKQLISEAKTQHRIDKVLYKYVFDDSVTEAF